MSLTANGSAIQINDIMEADSMLAERIESWFDEATRKGHTTRYAARTASG